MLIDCMGSEEALRDPKSDPLIKKFVLMERLILIAVQNIWCPVRDSNFPPPLQTTVAFGACTPTASPSANRPQSTETERLSAAIRGWWRPRDLILVNIFGALCGAILAEFAREQAAPALAQVEKLERKIGPACDP